MEDVSDSDNLLKIRADAELPSHKTEITLDDLDRDILEMHQRDVFFSYADLAEKWDVTVATIRNRIKRLKGAGVMDVILVMNPYKIGYNTFAKIGIKLETGAQFDDVISILLSIPGVTSVVMVAGRYDIFIDYVCKNTEEYRRFITEKLRRISGIANIESFIGLDLYERKFELGVIR
jgi:Lrp/AsnC family transcriptional regulator for asnA, asnC and gidA